MLIPSTNVILGFLLKKYDKIKRNLLAASVCEFSYINLDRKNI